MDIRALIRNVVAKVCMALVCVLALSSCNNWLYDEEGDCSVYYRLRFRYDRNLKWADAFANEVTSVHLYAFNTSGVLVWQKEEQIDPLMAADYSMLLDLPAGDYQLLAWCGLQNDGERDESFSVPEARIGETRMEELQCALNRKYNEAGAYSNERLYRLFHGMLEVSLPADEDGGSYDYTMYLTKNTNHIRVMLYHLSGEDVDVSQFNFRIEDENGLMAYDNKLLADETITYLPWDTLSSEIGLEREDGSRALVTTKGAIADFTVGRMLPEHREKMFLTITTKEGDLVGRIPLVRYALLGKEYYEKEYKHKMGDEEFLDREDEYVMTFFLDENHQWISSQILIHSWRIVVNDYDVETD
ncbi:MAG: FimB/Mfa2 family fimbrial subunit [Bacteroidaceae bacterium]|nr:FimB/Mfa2 family fimbrial subunit [Bacteroidaceae bacterium]